MNNNFDIVGFDEGPSAADLKAAEFESMIRRQYRWPYNRFMHWWANKYGSSGLHMLPNSGRQVIDAVILSNTKLRNYKIRLLAEVIWRFKPRRVLELGAGASTFLIGELLRRNALESGIVGKLVSVEQSSDYFKRIQLGINAGELGEFIALHQSTISLRWVGGYRALCYDSLPPFGHYDLVFVDGPAPPLCGGNNHPIFALSGDLIAMKAQGTTFSQALTDVRWMNAKFFQDQLAPEYKVRVDIPWRTIRISKIGG